MYNLKTSYINQDRRIIGSDTMGTWSGRILSAKVILQHFNFVTFIFFLLCSQTVVSPLPSGCPQTSDCLSHTQGRVLGFWFCTTMPNPLEDILQAFQQTSLLNFSFSFPHLPFSPHFFWLLLFWPLVLSYESWPPQTSLLGDRIMVLLEPDSEVWVHPEDRAIMSPPDPSFIYYFTTWNSRSKNRTSHIINIIPCNVFRFSRFLFQLLDWPCYS